MSHLFRRSAWMLALLGTLLLAACSVPGIGVKATPTPTADTIFSRAKAAQLKDATYSLTVTLNSPLGALTGTGDGTLTTQPQRTHITATFTIAGSAFPIEIITDSTGTYFKQRSEAKWRKAAPGDLPFNPGSGLGYDQIQHPTLVGSEKINGVATWHLRATTQTTIPAPTATPNATPTTATVASTEDLWVRQDNYYPAKVTVAADNSGGSQGGLGTATITSIFTAWNTGVTISVPTPDQIASGT